MTDEPTGATALTPEQLTAMGYRRTSNKYGMVSRVDRSDWVHVLAKELRRAPADFYVPGEAEPAANWCDYYRRVYSRDKLELDPIVARQIPTSTWDACGYIELNG